MLVHQRVNWTFSIFFLWIGSIGGGDSHPGPWVARRRDRRRANQLQAWRLAFCTSQAIWGTIQWMALIWGCELEQKSSCEVKKNGKSTWTQWFIFQHSHVSLPEGTCLVLTIQFLGYPMIWPPICWWFWWFKIVTPWSIDESQAVPWNKSHVAEWSLWKVGFHGKSRVSEGPQDGAPQL